jgi:cytochrome oxidase Cu insertion factor (SCO1/SenC/PrrC family)
MRAQRLTAILGLVCLAATAAYVEIGKTARGRWTTGEQKVSLGTVPDFSLPDHTGGTLSKADLAGRVWIASFVFTRCTEACPTLSGRTKSLLKEFAKQKRAVTFVSFTVDPDYDTTARLAEYAKTWGAQPPEWHFVTGNSGDLQRVVGAGLLQGVTRRALSDGGVDIGHSNRFIVVDGQGAMRGYFDALSPAEMDALRTLVAELVPPGAS